MKRTPKAKAHEATTRCLSLCTGFLMTAIVAVFVGAACSAACSDDSERARPRDSDPLAALQGQDVIERKSELGPVTAIVKVAPTNPTVGDHITVFLEVTAEPGVVVEMPDFGEALGRFDIARFTPRETTRDGKWVATQIYSLQTWSSGKQRIPPLRVEFVDERPSQTSSTKPGDASKKKTANPDTGTAANPDADAANTDEQGRIRELLTEEVAIQIASVMVDELQDARLGDARGYLRPPTITSVIWRSPWFWIAIAVVHAVGLAFGLSYWFRQSRERRRESAYALAIARLGKLEGRGLPTREQADSWYVELSSIIRHYLEDRYNLRAPELTTEEFLQVARGSGVLGLEHRKFLEDFLSRCDQVKFARYAPEDEESMAALASARAFLQDTRPDAEPSTGPGAEPGIRLPVSAGDPPAGIRPAATQPKRSPSTDGPAPETRASEPRGDA